MHENFDRPLTNYIAEMQGQTGFTEAGRVEVVEWLFGCAEHLRCGKQPAATAVNLFDRYLSVVRNVPMRSMQMIAAASLIVASKLGTVNTLVNRSDMCNLACNIFTVEELRDAELTINQTFNVHLVHPVTAHAYLQVFLHQVGGNGGPVGHTAELFADFACSDYGMLQFHPSVVAAACLIYALQTQGIVLEPALQLLLDSQLLDTLDEVQVCRARVDGCLSA